MIPLALFALAGCLAVGSGADQVVAGDLAAAYPEWAAVPRETPLGLAPAPGVERVFRVMELRRLAARWNVTPPPERDLCVARPVAMLTPELLLAAMRREAPTARIDLLDYSRQPAPEGELSFPLSGLQQGAAGGYWHGSIRYGGTHRFSVWARVKVLISAPRVVAADALRIGVPVEASQLRLEIREEPLSGARFPATVEAVAGQAPRHPIPAGASLREEWLEPPKVVLRGESVLVEVTNGAAHLKLEGTAESSGALGETIVVLNPISKHRFPARVEAKGRVVVQAPDRKGSL